MESLLNRLNLCFTNINLTTNTSQKIKILNKTLFIIKHYKPLMDILDYIHRLNPILFNEYIKNIGHPCLILMTYDLDAIGMFINLPFNSYIRYNNGLFKLFTTSTPITSRPDTPDTPITQESYKVEWGSISD